MVFHSVIHDSRPHSQVPISLTPPKVTWTSTSVCLLKYNPGYRHQIADELEVLLYIRCSDNGNDRTDRSSDKKY